MVVGSFHWGRNGKGGARIGGGGGRVVRMIVFECKDRPDGNDGIGNGGMAAFC